MSEVIVSTIGHILHHLANSCQSLTIFKIICRAWQMFTNLDHIDEHLTKFDKFANIVVWSTWYLAYCLNLRCDKFIQRLGRKRLEGADRGPNADPDGRADSRADSGADCYADRFWTVLCDSHSELWGCHHEQISKFRRACSRLYRSRIFWVDAPFSAFF